MQRQLDPVRVMGRSGLAFQGCSWDHRGVMGELQCKSWTRKRHHDGTRWNALLWTVWIMALAVASTGVEEVGGDPATDAVVMASLKAGITSLNLLPGRWSGSDPCLWHGVYCDSFNSVIRINISQLTLTGTVTRDIHKLTSLASLELGNNAFRGPLPTLQGMANLTLAEFFGNNFESIPTDFFDGLVSIRVISLTLNPLNDWRLPSSMNDAASTLEEFYAWGCGLVGELPSYLGTMPALKVLDLHNNFLSGSVPASFKNSGIQLLGLYNLYDRRPTGLTGGIDFVGGMANLRELILSGNSFTGPVPDGIVNATGLTSIYLDGNRLVGRLPQGLSALPNLDWVDLYGNYLSGELPPFGSGVHVNTTLPGQNSTFCGDRGVRCSTKVDALLDFLAAVDFPQEIATSWVGADPCAPVLWTGVSCNPFTSDVISIDLRNSSLAGTLSPSLGSLKSLAVLDLSGNALTGPIPQQLTFLTNLKTLDVSDNNLSSSLPQFDSSVRIIYTPGNPLLNGAPPPAMASPVVPSTICIVIVLVAVLVGIVLCNLVFWFFCFHIKRRARNTSLPVYGSYHSVG
ncbi:hypothetical protein M758_4G114700 [Ceratodon purpureus]|nr:hypothetical protein M758_4G114700 [Ceratodon purpureus]